MYTPTPFQTVTARRNNGYAIVLAGNTDFDTVYQVGKGDKARQFPTGAPMYRAASDEYAYAARRRARIAAEKTASAWYDMPDADALPSIEVIERLASKFADSHTFVPLTAKETKKLAPESKAAYRKAYLAHKAVERRARQAQARKAQGA